MSAVSEEATRELTGRVALVSGGSSGIGSATCRALLERGAKVAVADIQAPPDDLEALYVETDVRRAADWTRAVTETRRELGGLHLAFLNAGIALGESDVMAVSDEDVARIFDVNIDGVVLGARAVIPPMREGGGGAIVATASLAGLVGFSADPLYTATKHAVVGLCRAMAEPLKADGITINAVCPGITETPILSTLALSELRAANFPIMAPEQIADAVVGLFAGEGTGGAYVCQHGREPIRFEFRGVPGPAGHERPPVALRDPSIPN